MSLTLCVTVVVLPIVFAVRQVVSSPTTYCSTEIYDASGACYWKEEALQSWQDALITCTDKSGTLAVVDTYNVHIFLSQVQNSRLWIGLTDQETPGVYRWTNGRAITWSMWGNNVGTSNDACVYSYKDTGRGDREFYESTCDERRKSLCQSKPTNFFCLPSEPGCAPWIHIELTKVLMFTSCTDNDRYDTRNHATRNTHTIALCTQLLCQRAVHFICRSSVVDSSSCRGIELNQAEMVATGCLTAAADTTMYVRNYTEPELPHMFQYTPTDADTGTWAEAKDACDARGQRLMQFKSHDQNLQVSGWLGLTDEGHEGAYQWIDGSFPVWSNWAPTFPKWGRTMNCVYSMAGKWESRNCAEVNGFICELEAVSCTSPPGITCEKQGVCIHNVHNNSVGCECHVGHMGNNCETDFSLIVFTYAAIRVKVPYKDAYGNMSSSETGLLLAVLKPPLKKVLLNSVDILGFVNVFRLRSDSEGVIVDLEVGTESTTLSYQAAEVKAYVRLRLTEVSQESTLDDLPFDTSYVTVMNPVLSQDDCVKGPCEHGGTCTYGVHATCVCPPEYGGSNCDEMTTSSSSSNNNNN